MHPLAYSIFETNLGYCGIAWRRNQYPGCSSAVAYFQLPEACLEDTTAKVAKFCGAALASQPPEDVTELIDKVAKHFAGESQDFQAVDLELAGIGEFAQEVYSRVQKIPAGQTRTYGEVAKAMERPAAARAVGHALGRNPIALLIPCHRVLAANGNLGGFSAFGGVSMKLKMLELEGVKLKLRGP